MDTWDVNFCYFDPITYASCAIVTFIDVFSIILRPAGALVDQFHVFIRPRRMTC